MSSLVSCRIFSGSFALPSQGCQSRDLSASSLFVLCDDGAHPYCQNKAQAWDCGRCCLSSWDWNQPLGFLQFNFLEPLCFLIPPLLTWSSAWSLSKKPLAGNGTDLRLGAMSQQQHNSWRNLFGLGSRQKLKETGGKRKPYALISGDRRGSRFVPITNGREKE